MKQDFNQLLEHRLMGASLAFVAGSTDAYSYLAHGQVFAGLQTGNMILFGIDLSRGWQPHLWEYLLANGMFFVGVLLTRLFQHRTSTWWSQLAQARLILIYEAVVLAIAGYWSQDAPNFVINSLLALGAASQLQAFRRLQGQPYMSLLMTGNLRTLAEKTYDSIFLHHLESRTQAINMLVVLISFSTGAFTSSWMLPYLAGWTTLIPALALISLAIWLGYASQV